MEITMSRNELASRTWRVVVLSMLMLGTSCAPSSAIIKVEPPISSVQVNNTALVSAKVENIADLIAVEVRHAAPGRHLGGNRRGRGGRGPGRASRPNTFDNAA